MRQTLLIALLAAAVPTFGYAQVLAPASPDAVPVAQTPLPAPAVATRPAAARTTEVAAKPTAPTTMPADIVAAQDFLFSAYPELRERPLLIQLRPINGDILVSVADAPATRSDGPPSAPLLLGSIAFDARGRLLRYTAKGLLLDQTRNDLLTAQLVTHPSWGDSDLDAWLTSVGGPTTVTGARPVATGPTEPWRKYSGASVSAPTTRFQWRQDTTAARGSRAASSTSPAWVVDATAADADGTSRRYRLEYEPFGGRLVAVTLQ